MDLFCRSILHPSAQPILKESESYDMYKVVFMRFIMLKNNCCLKFILLFHWCVILQNHNVVSGASFFFFTRMYAQSIYVSPCIIIIILYEMCFMRLFMGIVFIEMLAIMHQCSHQLHHLLWPSVNLRFKQHCKHLSNCSSCICW